jgi:hypothetical protein
VADHNQFGSATPPQTGDAHHCAQCEAMLADALDGTLSKTDQAAFDLHMAGCTSCSGMLADARRGAAWMEMLKSSRPEPPDALLKRIFAQTCDKATNETRPAIILGSNDRLRVPDNMPGQPALTPSYASMQPPPAFKTANVLPFRTRITHGLRSIGQTMLQPRLAMTAAMAFFSIALTMNLTGIHLSNLRASDLRPSSIMRGCYDAKARVVRYSDNLRVVYELESRVRDLQHSSDDNFPSNAAPQATPAATNPQQAPTDTHQPDDQNPGNPSANPQNPDQKQSRPKPGSGSSKRENPDGNLLLLNSPHHHGTQFASMQPFVVFPPSVSRKEGGLV